MIDVPAFDNAGAPAGSVSVDESLLSDEVRGDLLRLALSIYEKRRRIGSRGTLTRGEVAGTTKKMYRQKGTGNARAGQRTVAQRRHGGVAFSLKNPTFRSNMPRKAQRQAVRCALLARLKDGEVKVVDFPTLEAPKTKAVAALLRKIGVSGSCLFVTDGNSPLQYKSARNINKCDVMRVQDLNVFTLLKPAHVVFTRTAMTKLMEGLAK